MSGARPPGWLERLAEWALPRGLSGQGALGDLAEDFERRALRSPWRARLWYAGQTVSILIYRVFTGTGAEGSSSDSDLLMDLRWSFRSILKHPGFAFGVVAVLGLGLGATVAVYSVVDGTLANTTWWRAPDRTAAIWPGRTFSFGHLEMYREYENVYDALGGYVEVAFAVETPDGESESVNGVFITPELFRELAVQPMRGRPLLDDDALLGVEQVAVMGESLWRRTFGADPAIVGSRVPIGGSAVTVVGVQPAGAAAPGGRAELWLPLVVDPRNDDYWVAQSYTLVGRLRDGATIEEAYEDWMNHTDVLSDMFPMFYEDGWAEGLATVERADEAQRRLISTPLLLLLGGTGLLMLVTALNVGTLLLGRAVERRKELAVRAALGAGRRRLVTQLLVEGFVLTALALGIGLLTGSLAGPWIAALFVQEAVVTSSSVLSPRVFGFGLAVSALAWLVLNGVPIAHFLRSQRAGPDLDPASGTLVQRSLVAVQAALATLLLVSATLLVATIENLRSVPLGFETSGLITIELSTPEDRVATPALARDLYDRLTERVRALPGVEAAGLTGWLPMRVQAPTAPVNLEVAPVDPGEAPKVPKQFVDPGFFEAFGVQAVEGRILGSEDRADEPSAVVVNETLARMLWPDQSPVGQRIAIDPHEWNRWVPVVGVVSDVRSGEITGPIGPMFYVSLAEKPSRDVTLVVRAEADANGLVALLRDAIQDTDPLVPIRSITEMDAVVKAAYATSWVVMGLLIVLAVLATALGTIGVYAVLSHHVALTRREIGVRMALGAQPANVVARVVRSGLLLAGIGIVAGSLAAMVSTRFLESLLYGVSALAPWAFMLPAAALLGAAALAAWVPASRAGRLPPAEVLRGE